MVLEGSEAAAEAFEGQDYAEEQGASNICYIRSKALENLKELLRKGEEISRADVDALMAAEDDAPDEIMIPLDMSGIDASDLENLDAFVERLGAKGVAEAFIEAESMFEAAQEWMGIAEQQEDGVEEGLEDKYQEEVEELNDGGQEEYLDNNQEDKDQDDDEVGADGGEEEAEEPATKRAKAS